MRTNGPGTPLAAAAFLALFGGQCAEGPQGPPDPERSLEFAVAEAVKIVVEEAVRPPEARVPFRELFKRSHFGISLDPEWMAGLDPELREATEAAARSLVTTAPLGFELVDFEAWERMPGCAPPELIELRESAPERSGLLVARVYPYAEKDGVMRIGFFIGHVYGGCPSRTGSLDHEWGTQHYYLDARRTPEGWEFSEARIASSRA